MILHYLTRVSIPSRVAQSLQIMAMCRAFSEVLKHRGGQLLLLSPRNRENDRRRETFTWLRPYSPPPWTRLRQMVFLFIAFLHLLRKRSTAVFTRDIAIAALASSLRRPTVYELHKEPRTLANRWVFALIKNNPRLRFVAISQALKNHYCEAHGLPPERILASHDGVFVEDYDALRHIPRNRLKEELGLPTDRKLIVHSGSLYPGRGAELFSPLLETFPELCLLQVGGHPRDLSFWKERTRHLTNLLFWEHRERETVLRAQLAADILFFPMNQNTATWWCCSPMKLFEYMAAARPLLASNIGSLSEVIDSSTAFLFQHESLESLFGATREIIRDPKQAESRAQNALKKVREHYRWQDRAQTIVDFIQSAGSAS